MKKKNAKYSIINTKYKKQKTKDKSKNCRV